MNHGSSTANRYRRLALSLLGGVYFALASVQVAAQVNVAINPSSGWAQVTQSTYSLPPSAKVTAGSGSPFAELIDGPAFRQRLPSGLELSATRQPGARAFVTLGSNLVASASAVKNAAFRCVSSLKCNFAFAAGAAGFEAFLDGVDWVMGPGGEITKNVPIIAPGGAPGEYYWAPSVDSPARGTTPGTACNAVASGNSGPTQRFTFSSITQRNANVWDCVLLREGLQGGAWVVTGYPSYPLTRHGSSCPPSSEWEPAVGACITGYDLAPVSSTELQTKIDSDYTPQADDWRFVLPGLDLSSPAVFIDVSPSPAASTQPSVTTNPDGSVSETSTSFDLDWLNNQSHKPRLDLEESTTTTNFGPLGEPLGSTTTTSSSTGASPSESPMPQPSEVPTDCDFMPTLCAFLDWFKEPDPDSSDPYDQIKDLVQVYDDPGTTVAIGPFNAACPAPRTISLSFVPSVEVSFQPFCDLAGAVRLWLLAIAYFGAAFVTVRSI